MTVTEALEAHAEALHAHKQLIKEATHLGQIVDAANKAHNAMASCAAEAYARIAPTQRALNQALLEQQLKAARQ